MKTIHALCSPRQFAGLLLLFVAALVAGCASDKDKAWLDLEELVEKENKTCPEDMGEGLTITSVTLEDDQLVMKADISADEEDVTPDLLRQNREQFKMGMFADLKDDADTRKMCELCVKAEVQIKIVFHFRRYGEDVQLVVPVNEIEEALQGKVSVDMDEDSRVQEDDEVEQARIALRGQIPTMRSQLPMVIEDGMTWTGVSYDGDNVTYVYTIDEEKIGGSVSQAYEGQQALLKNNIKVNFQGGDNTVKAFLQTCIQAGSGLIYSFVGDTTGESVSVRFKPAELVNLMQ